MVTCVVVPGTASCFWANSGTQKEWRTSSALSVRRAGRSTGSLSTFVVSFFSSGYSNVQANCCAVTSMLTGLEPVRSFRARTIAETIAMDVTRAKGIAVQPISRPVWPWIGGPSESSSGRDAELPRRVHERRDDDRVDDDADDRHVPEDEVDPVGLLRGARRQPVRDHGDRSR